MTAEHAHFNALFKRRSMAVAVTGALALTVVHDTLAQLEEVVVTATRREQSAIEVPYNISALSEDQLRAMNVADFSKLTRVVPGLQLTDRGVRDNTTSARIIMRGINTESAGFADLPFVTVSPVATYVDETPVFTNLRMYDIQRVEVLRGPQGTLYGSGSLGGTIRYLHNRPSSEALEGRLDVASSMTANADDPNYSFSGMLNIPLGDKLAARFSAGRDSYAGFIDAKRLAVLRDDGSAVLADPSDPFVSEPEFTSRDDVNEAEVTFFRGSLRSELTDALSIQLNVHHQEEEGDHRDAQAIGVPGIGERETAVTRLEPGERELDLYSLDVEADFGFASLTSSTSYFESESAAVTDGTGIYGVFGYLLAPGITAPIEINSEKEIFVQEFRLVSNTEGSIDWILGAFYMDEESVDIDEFDFFLGEGAIFGPYLTGPGDLFLNLNRQSDFEDMALYGEMTYQATDRLDLTAGVRAFKQEFTSASFFDYPAFGFYPGDVNDFDETDVLFKLNAAYDVNNHTMVYTTFAQGFRRGGANSIPTEGPLAEPAGLVAYDSDQADNYELGVKGTLSEQHQYSLAAYYVDWSDAQLGILTPVFGFDAAVNAGDAETYGIEAELFGNMSQNLSYTLGYAYTSAELAEDFSNFATGKKGNALPGVSEHTASLSLDYSQPLRGGYALNYHFDASYRSDFVNSVDTSADLYREFDGFLIAAAALTLEAPKWTLSLYGENLFDEEGISAQNEQNIQGAFHYVEWVTRPRTVGLRASYNF
jgi:outer membrane receptor protein involved in Fe transport